LKIHHPKNNHTVRPSFATYGKTKDIDPSTKLSARLKKNNVVVATSYKTLAGPPRWIIFFKQAPHGNGYTLEVLNDATSQILATVTNLAVQGAFAIDTNHPANNDEVCADLVAYGTTSVAGTVNCTMQLGTTVTNGDFIDPGVADNWVSQFPTLTPGQPYTFTATNAQGEPSTKTGIKVVTC